jgi:ABC-type sugar transport system permease subunit
MKRKKWNRKREKAFWGKIFVLPSFIIIAVFVAYPLCYTAYLSFCDYNFMYDLAPKFTGISNYMRLFKDRDFLISLKNTFLFSGMDFLFLMFSSFAISMLIFFSKKGTGFFRTAVFMPIVVPASLACIIFAWMFGENFGYVNYLLVKIGMPNLTHAWLTSKDTAMGTMIAANLWYNIGFLVILFLSGLQAISKDILEAAEVDGATGFRKIIYVIIPNLRETFVITGIWGIVTALKVFVEPMVMTNGGPGNATRTLYMYLYNTAFKFFKMGYASSMAFVLSALILAFSLLNMLAAKGDKE